MLKRKQHWYALTQQIRGLMQMLLTAESYRRVEAS